MTLLQQHQPTERELHPTIGQRPGLVREALLIVAVVAMIVTAGVLIGRATKADPAPPAGQAPAATIEMLRARVNAVNSGDVNAIAAFYAADAVLEEQDQTPAVVTTGNQAIATHLVSYVSLGFRLTTNSTALQYGRYVTETLHWSGGGGVCIYEVDAQLRIVHQWVIGGTP